MASRSSATLAALASLTLASHVQADTCAERAPAQPGTNCDLSTSPDVGFWDSLSWTSRALFPNTCNPTTLRGVRPQATVGSAPRNTSTEKRIVLVGDLMAAPEERVPVVSSELKQLFARADLIVGNVEAPLTCRTCQEPGFNPSATADGFQMSRSHLAFLLDQYGIAPQKAVLTLANNHSGDQGSAGVLLTEDAAETLVDDLGLKGVVGLRDASGKPRVSVHDFGALRVGVVGWTEVENCKLLAGSGLVAESCRTAGYPWLQTQCRSLWPTGDDITQQPATYWTDLKQTQGIDLLLGSVHWGEDFYTFPTQATRNRARTLEARGFDLIAAHHPHVLQPAEHLNPGNMVFYSLASLNLNWAVKDHTLIPVVEVTVNADGAIVEYTVHPFVYAKRSASIACRSACDASSAYTCDYPASSGANGSMTCSTDWSVIPLSAVSNLIGTRNALQAELDRVFPRTP